MSITIPLVNLASLTVGQTGRVLLINLGMSANPMFIKKSPTLRMHNDSGCGLLISFKVTSGAFYLPAGGWIDVQVDSAESEIDYQATYVLPGAPVNTLQITYYAPNETVPPMTQLGNSPIGVSGLINVATSSAIDNEGNIASTQWLKVIQSGGPASNLSSTVDGNFQIQQWDGATLKNLFHTIPNVVAGNSSLDLLASGLLGRVLGQLILANALPLQAFDNTATRRNILQVDAANNLQLFGITGLDLIQLLSSGGSLAIVADLINKSLDIKTSAIQVVGTTSGTATLFQFLTGTNVKAMMIQFNNYRNASVTSQNIALPVAFTTWALFFAGNGPFITPRSGGANLVNMVRVITALAVGGGTNAAASLLPPKAIGEIIQTFDGFDLGNTQGTANTSFYFFIGQ